MMRFVVAMNACVIALCVLAQEPVYAQANTQARAWDGTYTYAHREGKTAGGSAIALEYTVMLASPPTPHCSISINGFQTSEDILCTTRIDEKGVTLLFKEYATGKTTNQYDVAVYKVGAPLLALSRDTKGQPITTWHALVSKEDKPRPAGKYFLKTKR
jgi:hypothetical protein